MQSRSLLIWIGPAEVECGLEAAGILQAAPHDIGEAVG